MTMTIEDRNYLFEEYAYLVNAAMNEHHALIRVCRMEDDDIYQELSLCLLEALGRYDSGKCSSVEDYLKAELHSHLLNLKSSCSWAGVVEVCKNDFTLLKLSTRRLRWTFTGRLQYA